MKAFQSVYASLKMRDTGPLIKSRGIRTEFFFSTKRVIRNEFTQE
ncbi:1081_t:CDS:2 [Funneliformis geosporum]|nr:1081_t:CDS:2 [Funneliformis geosporum]